MCIQFNGGMLPVDFIWSIYSSNFEMGVAFEGLGADGEGSKEVTWCEENLQVWNVACMLLWIHSIYFLAYAQECLQMEEKVTVHIAAFEDLKVLPISCCSHTLETRRAKTTIGRRRPTPATCRVVQCQGGRTCQETQGRRAQALPQPPEVQVFQTKGALMPLDCFLRLWFLFN